MTDPALYKTLRDQITRFHLRGGGAINLAKLERLMRGNERDAGERDAGGSTSDPAIFTAAHEEPFQREGRPSTAP